MARRTYSDEEKAAGLAALALHGGDVSKAARALSTDEKPMDRRTLRRWRDEAPTVVAQIAQDKKDDLRALMNRIAHRAAGLIELGFDALEASRDDNGQPNVGAVALKNLPELNRIMGTALDKRQLLGGEPTERVEHVATTPEEAVAAMQRLRLLQGKRDVA